MLVRSPVGHKWARTFPNRMGDPAAPKQAAAELREAKDEIRALKDAVAKLAQAAAAPAAAPALAPGYSNGLPLNPYPNPAAQPCYTGPSRFGAAAPGAPASGRGQGFDYPNAGGPAPAAPAAAQPPPPWPAGPVGGVAAGGPGGPSGTEGTGSGGEPQVHGAAAAAGMGVLPGAGPPLAEPPHPASYMEARPGPKGVTFLRVFLGATVHMVVFC